MALPRFVLLCCLLGASTSCAEGFQVPPPAVEGWLDANEESPLERQMHMRDVEAAKALAKAAPPPTQNKAGLLVGENTSTAEDKPLKDKLSKHSGGGGPRCDRSERLRIQRVMYSDVGDFVGTGRRFIGYHFPTRTTEGGKFPECSRQALIGQGPNAKLMAQCVGRRADLSKGCGRCWDDFADRFSAGENKQLFKKPESKTCRDRCGPAMYNCWRSFDDMSKSSTCLDTGAVDCLKCLQPALEELTECVGFDTQEDVAPAKFSNTLREAIVAGRSIETLGMYVRALHQAVTSA